MKIQDARIVAMVGVMATLLMIGMTMVGLIALADDSVPYTKPQVYNETPAKCVLDDEVKIVIDSAQDHWDYAVKIKKADGTFIKIVFDDEEMPDSYSMDVSTTTAVLKQALTQAGVTNITTSTQFLVTLRKALCMIGESKLPK